jgi:ferredoxin
MKISKRIVLHYPPDLTEKPVVYQLVKKYHIMFNILRANFSADGIGMLLLELTGEKNNLTRGLDYLKKIGVKTELLSQDIERIEERCVHCGFCAMVCPSRAISIQPVTMRVMIQTQYCIGCEECVRVCPYKAIKVFLN